MTTRLNLSPQEARLLAFMKSKGYDVDVSTYEVFAAAIGGTKETEHRLLQQRLGACVSKLNRKLAAEKNGGRIVPGLLKRTYRLVRN